MDEAVGVEWPWSSSNDHWMAPAMDSRGRFANVTDLVQFLVPTPALILIFLSRKQFLTSAISVFANCVTYS